MWLLTPFGFFSVVQKKDDAGQGTLTVRARVREDLEALKKQYLPGMGEIKKTPNNDYHYRATVPRGELAVAMANMVMELDYSNFKSEVAEKQGYQRAHLYGGVWSVLEQLQHKSASPSKEHAPRPKASGSPALAIAYGGILVDDQNRVLLREPANHYDGYVWTFPKGRPDPGETPEQTALREVKEETGYDAVITGTLPGDFAGGTTSNRYFLMKSVGDQEAFEMETSQTCWASLSQAKELINKTTNATGRKRDLSVLAALQKMLSAPTSR